MRRNERIYEDDDGRTVADMSGIEPQPMLIPRIHKRRDRADFREPDVPEANDRPWDTSGELNREERNAAIGGALLMLAILLMLKLPKDTHNEPTSEVKYEDISGVSFGEPFDFTWVD